MLYAVRTSPAEATKAGFIVSKSVGNAVTRNLVKRRLRELAAADIQSHPTGLAFVVRALAPAAGASWLDLSRDYGRARSVVFKRLGGGDQDFGAEEGHGE